MWKVEKFLGCCNLERALVILSWLSIIFGILGVIGYTVAAVAALSADCNSSEVREIVKNYNLDQENCQMILTIASVVIIVVIIFSILGIVLHYIFIRGVNTRNHRLIAPLMILVGAVAVLSGLGAVLSLLSMHAGKIISGVLYFVIAGYFFLCYHTVYEKVRDEKFNNVQYRPT